MEQGKQIIDVRELPKAQMTFKAFEETGDSYLRIYVYVVRSADIFNLVRKFPAEIAEDLNIDDFTVESTLRALILNGVIKQISEGCYMLKPELYPYYNSGLRAVVIERWGAIE